MFDNLPETWPMAIASSFGISAAALVGIFVIIVVPSRQSSGGRVSNVLNIFLISLAIGCLLGDVFLHLLPQVYGLHVHDHHEHEEGDADAHHHHDHSHPVDYEAIGLRIILGFFACGLVEYIVHSLQDHGHGHEGCHGHSHNDDAAGVVHNSGRKESNVRQRKGKSTENAAASSKPAPAAAKRVIAPVGYLNLLADGVHNLMDGLAIGAAYSISLSAGNATAIACLFHEIPQEFGDFGVLVAAGFSRTEALVANFLSGCTCVLGTMIAMVYVASGKDDVDEHFHTSLLISLTIGSFIYIAAVDMLPFLMDLCTKKSQNKKSMLVLACTGLALGVQLMIWIGQFEESMHHHDHSHEDHHHHEHSHSHEHHHHDHSHGHHHHDHGHHHGHAH